MSKGTKVHDVAASGFSEGTNDLYDKSRPSYPSSALWTVSSAFPPRSNLTILEPGSGTGIFSRILISPPTSDYPKIPIKRLIGVEPSEGMRNAWFRGLERIPKTLLEGKEVKCVQGSFDDFSKTGVEKGEVDGIVIAQAWHWCPDHEKALTEILDYLKPDGVLIFVWNIESNELGWFRSLRELYEPLDLGSPQYYRGLWRQTFEAETYKNGLQPPEMGTSEWEMVMDEDMLVQRLFSKSYLTEKHLNGQRRIDFEKELRRLIREGDKQWVDKEKGTFIYRYNTDTVVMRRKQTA
ncbi:hypothetical protein M231_07780 [Tremella mesenterica]|uniref:Methyltransferase type 11 domain-containing protein n=1 Tax=Tremella mesenterica TaxID=5217 RepID=A0A4Q1BB79_TREME|nr:hypothetical protein M231_07780 [Tremella mesenterica]